MIVFINFAPIQFLGGAERWTLKMQKKIRGYEEAYIFYVSPIIANIYSSLILKRNFNNRAGNKNPPSTFSIKLIHFIPFTNGYFFISNKLKESRLICIKYEFLELLLLIYFGGFKVLNKTVGVIHSSIIYQHPISLFDKLHNYLYSSSINKFFLKRLKKIQVLNNTDKEYLMNDFQLRNVVKFPNSIEEPKISKKVMNKKAKALKIIFIGELSLRKGVDILLEVIKKSPYECIFYIVGDGPFKSAILELSSLYKNCIYKDYLKKDDLYSLYNECDALFLPSRAEGMPFVILEAMAFGLKIVDSKTVSPGLPKFMEYCSTNNSQNQYLAIFARIRKERSNRKEIQKYFQEHFSDKKVLPDLLKEIYGIS